MGCKEVKYFHHVPLENVEIVIKALRAYKPEENQEEPQPNFYYERFNRVI